jgi:hypothetical protein
MEEIGVDHREVEVQVAAIIIEVVADEAADRIDPIEPMSKQPQIARKCKRFPNLRWIGQPSQRPS